MKGIRAVLFQTVLRNVPYLNLHKRVLETGDTIKNISRSDSHHPKKKLFYSFTESPLKMMKNAFYFILKALFLLRIFNFRLFGFRTIRLISKL